MVDLKLIAKTEASIFGGTPSVVRHWDSDETKWVDILSCADRPIEGVTSWGTIGMSQYDNSLTTNGKHLRIELVGACSSGVEQFGNVLSTCALNVATGEFSVKPGRIFPDVVAMYIPDVSMKHALFVTPFPWDTALTPVIGEEETVAWLMAVPVSHSEFEFARQEGSEKLEELLEEQQIDVVDIDRHPVV